MVASPTTAETSSVASGLLIFDGDCGFCTKAARKFADFAGDSALVQPWQALDLDDYGLTEADVTTAAYWVHGAATHRGADAVAHGLQSCRQPLRLLGMILAVPPFIWAARLAYRVIAKNRYHLPGSTDACRLD